jgi:hypothetical protein
MFQDTVDIAGQPTAPACTQPASANMQLTVAAQDDRVFQVELDDNETLSTLMAILEAESNIPSAQQQLVHNGRPLLDTAAGQTLSALGIANGDMLMLLQKPPAAAAPQQHQRPAANPNMALAEDGSARAPAAFIQSAKASPETMAMLATSRPNLAAAIRNEDVAALQVGLGVLAAAVSCSTAVHLSTSRSSMLAGRFTPTIEVGEQDVCTAVQ